MEFKDISSNYHGKMLRAFVDLDSEHVAEVNLYYSDQIIYEKNVYGCTMPVHTGYQDIKLNVSKMRKEGTMLVGGLGNTKTVMTDIKRKTLKALQMYTQTLTVDQIKELAKPQTTKPSRIV